MVFQHMMEKDIKLNLSKCHIRHKEIKFWGHIVSHKGYGPDPSNIEAINNMKALQNVEVVRRFLGMCSFYRRHVKRYASIAAPADRIDQERSPVRVDTRVPRSVRGIKDEDDKSTYTG